MTTGEATLTRAGGATFMGHPKGLFYLAFTEAWERFSFYGMTALVVLYMVNQLSGLFVAAIMITFRSSSRPSISVKNWLITLSVT